MCVCGQQVSYIQYHYHVNAITDMLTQVSVHHCALIKVTSIRTCYDFYFFLLVSEAQARGAIVLVIVSFSICVYIRRKSITLDLKTCIRVQLGVVLC